MAKVEQAALDTTFYLVQTAFELVGLLRCAIQIYAIKKLL